MYPRQINNNPLLSAASVGSTGAIEYLGRIDHQVKIRGFRVELGEIEAVLKKHGTVRECVVLVQEQGAESHRRLVAYVVTRKPQYDVPRLAS
jgi:acyl-coenzyme A synthetase/AMP-(fatty) acid ligase